MLLGAAAIATMIASGIMNMKINNNMLTDLAKKGFTLKKDRMCAFKWQVKDISLMHLIPIINIGYTFIHGAHKYANRDAHFAKLIMKGEVEKISKEKNDRLKSVDDKDRPRAMMKMRIRERLGLKAVSKRDMTGAKVTTKVKNGLAEARYLKTKNGKRREALLAAVGKTDEKTRQMLEELLNENPDKYRVTDTNPKRR